MRPLLLASSLGCLSLCLLHSASVSKFSYGALTVYHLRRPSIIIRITLCSLVPLPHPNSHPVTAGTAASATPTIAFATRPSKVDS